MSSVNKPVIPADVADAIEYLRGSAGHVPLDNETILYNVINPTPGTEHFDRVRSLPFDTLLAALVNGYERELTEEERWAKRINEALGWMEESRRSAQYKDGYHRGVMQTLAILGIKIEGVNA
ncbi:DUF1642 domain-containing protein [Neobacillus mesonae]|nr:DUF1642 domain-containing protein [Neobacillus mesonae]